MSLFTRNLAKYGKDVEFFTREERPINGRPTETFTSLGTDRAIIKTVSGVTVFDATNIERAVTHRLCLVYRADIDTEVWVQKVGSTTRLRILTVENVCEADEELVLMCTERGEDSKVVNRA